MNTKVQRILLGAMAVPALTVALLAAAPAGSSPYTTCSPSSSGRFRVDVTTDKDVYAASEDMRLTVRLLNDGASTVFVGIGPDEPTFEAPGSGQVEPLTWSIPVGYALLTPLDAGPIICTETVLPDGTVVRDCPQIRRYELPLFRSNQVLGHSTQIVCTVKVPLADGPWFDPDEAKESQEAPDLCVPLEPGHYLLDCHIEGICGASEARAQRIIEINS